MTTTALCAKEIIEREIRYLCQDFWKEFCLKIRIVMLFSLSIAQQKYFLPVLMDFYVVMKYGPFYVHKRGLVVNTLAKEFKLVEKVFLCLNNFLIGVLFLGGSSQRRAGHGHPVGFGRGVHRDLSLCLWPKHLDCPVGRARREGEHPVSQDRLRRQHRVQVQALLQLGSQQGEDLVCPADLPTYLLFYSPI